jgi:hypothetical protein
MGEMRRAIAYQEKERQKQDRFASTQVIAASIIAAVGPACDDISRPSPLLKIRNGVNQGAVSVAMFGGDLSPTQPSACQLRKPRMDCKHVYVHVEQVHLRFLPLRRWQNTRRTLNRMIRPCWADGRIGE